MLPELHSGLKTQQQHQSGGGDDGGAAKDHTRMQNVREWFSKKCYTRIPIFSSPESAVPSSMRSVLVTRDTVPKFTIPFTAVSSPSTSSPTCSTRVNFGSTTRLTQPQHGSSDVVALTLTNPLDDYNDAQWSQPCGSVSLLSCQASPNQHPANTTTPWNLKLLAPQDGASRRQTVSAPVSPCNGERRPKAKSTGDSSAYCMMIDEEFVASATKSDEELLSAVEESVRRFTNVDPLSLAAISLPHFHKQTKFGFDTVTQLPHTRRKESLFFDSSPSSSGAGNTGGKMSLFTHGNKHHKHSTSSWALQSRSRLAAPDSVESYHGVWTDGNYSNLPAGSTSTSMAGVAKVVSASKTGADCSPAAGRRRNDLPNIVAPLGVLPFCSPTIALQTYTTSTSSPAAGGTAPRRSLVDSSPESIDEKTLGRRNSWTDYSALRMRGAESPQHEYAGSGSKLLDGFTMAPFDADIDRDRKKHQRRNSSEGRVSLYSVVMTGDKQRCRKSSSRGNLLAQLRRAVTGSGSDERVKRAFSLSQSLCSLRLDTVALNSTLPLADSLLQPYRRSDIGRVQLVLRYDEQVASLNVRLLSVDMRLYYKTRGKNRGSGNGNATSVALPNDSPTTSSTTLFVRLCLMPGKEQQQTSAVWQPDDALDVDEEFTFRDVHVRQMTLTRLRLKVIERRRNLKNTDEVIGDGQVCLAHVSLKQGNEHTAWLELQKKIKSTVSVYVK